MRKYEFKRLHKIKWKKIKKSRQKAFKKNKKTRTIVRKKYILKKLRSALPYRFSKFWVLKKKHLKYWHYLLKIIRKFSCYTKYFVKKPKITKSQAKKKILKKNKLLVKYWPRLIVFRQLELPAKVALKRASKYWVNINRRNKRRCKLKKQLIRIKKYIKKLSKKRRVFNEKFVLLKLKKKKVKKKKLIFTAL